VTLRVEIRPELLHWAIERAGMDVDALLPKFPKAQEWLSGSSRPTLKQLEKFANTTHTPVGYLMLEKPPVESVPIPDLRTIGNETHDHPSPDLLDTIYICQQRQEWYRDFCRSVGQDALPFIGSVPLGSDTQKTAAAMRNALELDLDERRAVRTWTEALRRFIEAADKLGVLVMVSGVVGSNNRRKLNPSEFRGFALSDPLAPVVFINGSDTKAAQMFTLAHELAHLWLGESALSDVGPMSSPSQEIEKWCNQVAAELLVPIDEIAHAFAPGEPIDGAMSRLARRFKVSTLVVLRRLHDAGHLTRQQYWDEYERELTRLRRLTKGSGGDFYLTHGARVGKRFARALVVSTLEGHTLHRDAFRLLGFSKVRTFHELGRRLGVM
jgi:Zn-dependent peptidase ImmA (M78 family)